jgi:hypothetical protein
MGFGGGAAETDSLSKEKKPTKELKVTDEFSSGLASCYC